MILCRMMRMHVMMYGDVTFLVGENKSRSCWRIELSSSFPPGMMNEDDKPAGEKKLRWGNKLMKRLLRGELLCGGRDVLLKILTITPLGILLISSVGDFDDELCWG